MSIEARGLVYSYGELKALDDVSLHVENGEVLGFLGPNGAGKSTTVQLLMGLLRPQEGCVRVAGVDLARNPVGVREKIGYVPEQISLYEALTPWEHLWFVARLRRMDEKVIERRVEALLRTFSLTDRAHQPIRTFSKGMRQKVALSLALIHRPAVLILDEPLAGLDATAGLILKDVIRGFAARGAAVLYCSHVLDVVEKVCGRAQILNRGRTVAAGTIEELRAQTANTTLEEVFRTVATDADPAGLAQDLLEVLES